MDTYYQQRQKVLQLLNECITFIQTSAPKNTDIIERLRNTAEHITQEKLLVMVCGEFKQGKSSLINALLNEPDLFPVDLDITTGVVSMVSFAPQQKFSVLLGEPGQEVSKQIQRHEITEYVSEQRNQRNSKQARLLSIELPNERLRDGLVLVDTPDVGGLYRQHTDITYTFLPNADAVLFVSDALSPLHVRELDFVQRIARHCQHTLYVVTKTDIVDDYQAIVESNRKKLSYILKQAGNDLHIIPVSSRMKLHYLQSNDIEDLELSNFLELEQALWDLLGERSGVLLGHALRVLDLALAEVLAPLETEMQALQQNSAAETQELERRWNTIRHRLQEIVDNKSEWHIHLQRDIAEIQAQARDTLKHAFVELRKKLTAYLDTPELLKSPTTISTMIEQDVYELIIMQDTEIQQLLRELLAQMERETHLSLNIGFTEILDQPQTTLSMTELPHLMKTGLLESIMLSMHEAGDKATTIGQKAAYTGAKVGQFVEFVSRFTREALPKGTGEEVGTRLGGLIGTVAGFTAGFVDEMRQIVVGDQQKTREEVRRIVGAFIDQSSTLYQDNLKNALSSIESYILQALTEQVRLEEEICERTLVTLQGTRNLSQKEVLIRRSQLQRPLQEAERLKKNVEELARAIIK